LKTKTSFIFRKGAWRDLFSAFCCYYKRSFSDCDVIIIGQIGRRLGTTTVIMNRQVAMPRRCTTLALLHAPA